MRERMIEPPDSRWETLRKYYRSEGARGVIAAPTSIAFIGIGLLALVSGEVLLGSMVIVFFSAVLLVFVVHWNHLRRHGEPYSSGSPTGSTDEIATAVATVLMGLGGLGMAIFALGDNYAGWRPRETMIAVGIFSTLFFGGGGIYVFVRNLRKRQN